MWPVHLAERRLLWERHPRARGELPQVLAAAAVRQHEAPLLLFRQPEELAEEHKEPGEAHKPQLQRQHFELHQLQVQLVEVREAAQEKGLEVVRRQLSQEAPAWLVHALEVFLRGAPIKREGSSRM